MADGLAMQCEHGEAKAELLRLVAASRTLRREVAAQGVNIDSSGRDTTPEMQSVARLGLHRISLPRAYLFLMHAALLLGIGRGALDAALEHVCKSSRVVLPEFKSPKEDPFVRFHLGDISIRMRASRAHCR